MFDARHLSPDERARYNELLYAAGYDETGKARPSAEIPDRLHALLLDAVQAHEMWAQYVIDDDTRAGHLKRFTRWNKVRDVVDFSDKSLLVKRSAVMGIRRRRKDTGAPEWRQTSWEDMTWDEVAQVLDAAQARAGSEMVTVAVARKLLHLKSRAPRSTGPADACASLGTSVKDYLAAAGESGAA